MLQFPKSRTAGQSLPVAAPTSAGVPVFIRCGNSRFSGQVLESSPYDIRFETTGRLGVKDIVTLCWGSQYLVSDIEVSGVIHWIEKSASKTQFGLATLRPIPEELLLDDGGLQRSSIRYQCRFNGRIQKNGSTSSSPAVVLNYSRGGVCIQSDAVVEKGDEIVFETVHDSVSMPVQKSGFRGRLAMTVRWISGQMGVRLLGCSMGNEYGYLLSGVDLRRSQIPSEA